MPGTGTIGKTENCSDITQNSYNGNTYNFIKNLNREPRNIRVHAVRNYLSYYFILASIIAFLVFLSITFVGYSIDNDFLQDNNIVLLVAFSVSVVTGASSSILFFDKVFKKVKWGYVLYKNKTIIYNLKREKFYDDIWDIELKETWLGYGRLRYFGVTKRTDKPYYREITLMNYAQAKYIYDSFWNAERVEKN